MPKRLGSADPPLIYQRGFEPNRVEQQLWSEAYECLVPERRRPLAPGDVTVPCGKPAPGLALIHDSQEGKCA